MAGLCALQGDRLGWRKVLIFSDVLRGLVIGAIGAMAVAGVLQLWHLYFLVALGQLVFLLIPGIFRTERDGCLE